MLNSLVQQSSLSVEQNSILSLSPMSSEVIRVLLLSLLGPCSSLTPAINVLFKEDLHTMCRVIRK